MFKAAPLPGHFVLIRYRMLKESEVGLDTNFSRDAAQKVKVVGHRQQKEGLAVMSDFQVFGDLNYFCPSSGIGEVVLAAGLGTEGDKKGVARVDPTGAMMGQPTTFGVGHTGDFGAEKRGARACST